MDLAGIALSDARPVESFGLGLIRFGIDTLYIGRVAGYAADILEVRIDDTRAAFLQRMGLREGS
jgi:hypothetical protein